MSSILFTLISPMPETVPGKVGIKIYIYIC